MNHLGYTIIVAATATAAMKTLTKQERTCSTENPFTKKRLLWTDKRRDESHALET